MKNKICLFFTALSILLYVISSFLLKIKTSENNLSSTLAIMVYDESTSNYVSSNVIPKGDYKLNTDKTYCIGGSTVPTFDSKNGAVSFLFDSAGKCNLFFDIIKRVAPTFVPSTTTVSNDYYASATTSSVTLNYNGDGAITCSPTSGTYSNCSVSGKTVIFTKKAAGGPENFTITAAETDDYKAATQIVAVSWTCLDEDTLVAYWDRKKKKKLKKRIKDFKEGDIVYSYDERARCFVTRKVKQVVINKTKEVYHIFVGGEDIKTTATHPFYINGAGYLNASMIKAGCELISADGEVKIVEKVEVEVLAGEKKMYCLELEDGGSSFAVGTTGIVCLAMFVDGLALLLTPTRIAYAHQGGGDSGAN